MRGALQVLFLGCSMLLAPALPAAEEDWSLAKIGAEFTHAQAGVNCTNVLTDGWQIAFLSHDGVKIGAAIIREVRGAGTHERSLSGTLSRVAELVGMRTPEALEFEEDYPMALLLDQAVMQNLVSETEHVFDGSPLAAMAYLLNDGYFIIHSIRENGHIHWKTAKKSGVELYMPMAEKKLGAIEVAGRQQMDEYASEVLASKLGLDRNNVSDSYRSAVCKQLKCSKVPYMNNKSNVVLARTERRAVIGKRQTVGHLLGNRNSGALVFPSQVSLWPEEKVEEPPPVKEEPAKPAEPEKPRVLTPEEAREAYLEKIRNL